MTGTTEPSERLLVIEQVVSCTRCVLHTKATAPVAFSGPTPCDVAVIAEAPGKTEDAEGAPLIGPAGKLLREHLEAVGIDPTTVAFLNTASCYPGDIKTPQWDHVEACAGNKERQLQVINPKFVLLLGKVALKAERGDLEIGRARAHPWQHHRPYGYRVYFATYHPAAALRNGLLEKGMREDLEIFAAMVAGGHDKWEEYLSDRCVICGEWMYWMEETGLAYCETHMPEDGHKHKAQVDQDLALARQRLEAGERRSEGMAHAEQGAGEDWVAATEVTLRQYLKTHAEFFVDDFWNDTKLDPGPSPRALGPIIARASKDGLIEQIDHRPSVRSNMTAKPVWRSLVFEAS